MDLQQGKFYWETTMPKVQSYPFIEENIECDILIVGAGIAGAYCANLFSETNLDIVVVDKRKVGAGSTSVSAGLLQYLGDKMLHQLVNHFGEKAAIMHTKLCEEAIQDIEKISNALDIETEFRRRDTLYYVLCQ